jgi:hypothetical protein
MQVGRAFESMNPKPKKPIKVRFRRTSRGQRAWRATKTMHETGEALNSPAALTTRAKRVRHHNPKKWGLKELRESDQPIVASGKARAPKLVKELTS